MSTEIVGVIGIVAVLVLLFSRMHIGLVLALVGFLGLMYLISAEAAGTILQTSSLILLPSLV